ncbi:MAG: adenylosuccinate lyase [Flavobacteriaceae bacterium]
MKKHQLYEKLNYVNHSRAKRLEMAKLVLDNPRLVIPLMDIAFDVDEPISSRACWVLEFTAKKNLRYLDPYLDTFVENLPSVHLDSSVRPMAKICEYLILEYYQGSGNQNVSQLNRRHLELIATASFDWLIGPQKVAPKAYSITVLYHLGKDIAWIHPELKLVLEKDYNKGSAGFKARARQVLPRL